MGWEERGEKERETHCIDGLLYSLCFDSRGSLQLSPHSALVVVAGTVYSLPLIKRALFLGALGYL